MFRVTDRLMIPLSIIVGGVILASVFSGYYNADADDPYHIVPILFSIFAIYVLIGRYIADMVIRTATVYVVTDHASYIVRPWFLGGTRRFGPADAANSQRELGAFGTGTIRFRPLWSSLRRTMGLVPSATAFERVSNVANVYHMVIETIPLETAPDVATHG